MKKLITPLWLLMMLVVLVNCGSMKKSTLKSGNDPQKAVAEVTQIRDKALADQLDLIAGKSFEDGNDYLEEAGDSLNRGQDAAVILDKASIAKALFEDAEKLNVTRREFANKLLDARAAALSAGARSNKDLLDELVDIDEDVRDDSKQFSRTLSAEAIAEFKNRYLKLEVMSVQHRELAVARIAIDEAIDQEAENLAPNSLVAAQADFDIAMKTIANHPRDRAAYKKSVDTELSSASMLVDVMNIIRENSGTPESVAVQIVKQKRKLGQLSTTLKSTKQTLQEKEQSLQMTHKTLKEKEQTLQTTKQTLQEKEQSLQSTQESLEQKEGKLKEQEKALANASMSVRYQQAMEEARQMIPESDAYAYQQGDNLVFRLKRMNFPFGKSNIPEVSKSLLDKVDSIIKKLDAHKVVVQGHTDSVGTEEVNEKLSQDRSEAVATYLQVLRGGYRIQHTGYGEAFPIATNETEEGRATNRRVDLIVSVKE